MTAESKCPFHQSQPAGIAAQGGGTTNREGSRRRVLHGLYIDRADTAQQDQRRWLTPETASRLTPAQKWLLDVE